ncbi:MAG: hypothetical protein EHM93_17965 [Bacteroidales bacterium]|nr:MAG: hypothetical protein EHM93_17965 [Bacteroidales bacterium]
MKTIKSIIAIVALAIIFYSCEKDDSLKPKSIGFDEIVAQTTDTFYVRIPIGYTIFSKALKINTICSTDYDSIVLNNIRRIDGAPLADSYDATITDIKESGVKIDRATGVFILTDSLDLKEGMHSIDIAIYKNGNTRVFEGAYLLSVEGMPEIIDKPYEEEDTIVVKSGEAFTSNPIVYNINGNDALAFGAMITNANYSVWYSIYTTKAEWEKSEDKKNGLYGVEIDKQGRIIIYPENNIPEGNYTLIYSGTKENTWKFNSSGSYGSKGWSCVELYYELEITN